MPPPPAGDGALEVYIKIKPGSQLLRHPTAENLQEILACTAALPQVYRKRPSCVCARVYERERKGGEDGVGGGEGGKGGENERICLKKPTLLTSTLGWKDKATWNLAPSPGNATSSPSLIPAPWVEGITGWLRATRWQQINSSDASMSSEQWGVGSLNFASGHFPQRQEKLSDFFCTQRSLAGIGENPMEGEGCWSAIHVVAEAGAIVYPPGFMTSVTLGPHMVQGLKGPLRNLFPCSVHFKKVLKRVRNALPSPGQCW